MNAILKYPGAKWRIADWIIENMPTHHSYIEPYFGSGAIFFNKSPSNIETINDLDGEVVNFFEVVRDMPEELAAKIEIKVKDPNRWKLKHRYIWEKENGKIPKGMLLIFKDNNKLNIDLDNLMLISRAENAVINRAGDSVFTGQTKEVIVNLARLKRAIGKAKKGVDE